MGSPLKCNGWIEGAECLGGYFQADTFFRSIVVSCGLADVGWSEPIEIVLRGKDDLSRPTFSTPPFCHDACHRASIIDRFPRLMRPLSSPPFSPMDDYNGSNCEIAWVATPRSLSAPRGSCSLRHFPSPRPAHDSLLESVPQASVPIAVACIKSRRGLDGRQLLIKENHARPFFDLGQ